MARVCVYIDGFNLYHGAKELVKVQNPGASWKWLDLVALSRRICPRDEIKAVKYYTARVSTPDTDPDLGQRQQVYLRALATAPLVSIHYGQFMLQKKRMPLVNRPTGFKKLILQFLGMDLKTHPDGNVTVSIWRMEEKGTDVNLGVHLVADAFQDRFDKAIVISNDTDLCEPVRLVVSELGRKVVIVNPRGHKQPAAALRKVATETRKIRATALLESQLPNQIEDQWGTITRPANW